MKCDIHVEMWLKSLRIMQDENFSTASTALQPFPPFLSFIAQVLLLRSLRKWKD
jgi:hypothetical protein